VVPETPELLGGEYRLLPLLRATLEAVLAAGGV